MPRKHQVVAADEALESRMMEGALAQLPARMRRATRRFATITGEHVVTSLASPVSGTRGDRRLAPPIHPLCRDRIREMRNPPCAENWQEHVRKSLESRSIHSHVCPLGLHCSLIPIYLGSSLVGAAKLVMEGEAAAGQVAAATATLALNVTLACQECYVSVVRHEMASMGRRVQGLLRFGMNGDETAASGSAAEQRNGGESTASSAMAQRALRYVIRHCRDPRLSAVRVAAALGCNPKYLVHVFARTVGETMSSYIRDLRVDLAARQLLERDAQVKDIAYSCGFRNAGTFARTFRERVGVSPAEYRRLFVGKQHSPVVDPLSPRTGPARPGLSAKRAVRTDCVV